MVTWGSKTINLFSTYSSTVISRQNRVFYSQWKSHKRLLRRTHNYKQNNSNDDQFDSVKKKLQQINDTNSKITPPSSLLRNMDTPALLLQKNIIQRNNSIFQYSTATIRCTVFDSMGKKTPIPVDIKREDLVSLHGLLPRDFRKFEKSKRTDLVPTILVRKNTILISLLTIRALIKPDMVILFDSVGNGIPLNSEAHRAFLSDLQTKLRNESTSNEITQDPLPYELRALESIFLFALTNLTSEMKVLLAVCNSILEDLEYSITRGKLRFLLSRSKKLTVFHKKSILVRDMLNDLLEDEEMLCSLYITDRLNGHERCGEDHEEIEMLIETYYSRLDEIVQHVESAISNVKTTEEIINIILDSNRNQLMLLGIKFGIGMLSMGSIIFVGSIYGMNLENFIEETSVGFGLVVTVGVIGMLWLFFRYFRDMKSLEKMSMTINPKTMKKR
ncbi:hypothetical protein TBLA_0H03520 [Henningerozyma blattae CBS 6284]|uniref:Magnesium transporter n=1 Tax=Henningerozyma blattae (strain ATCC 34711 / CBS 6284 / DSM 70876 / NBRC 10599 / NRRL Y-10934 / UCD 77-7) TaxID=1071380 RepID=I2H8D1_HENB6|nr:hypothetical protein TBLA_0H03520 [Tetrapisispora blattae CBS 6284]CCH62633.1 hypothetical protein TBLA_0H03520 [Tetrapisispora blattae CBS 6284]